MRKTKHSIIKNLKSFEGLSKNEIYDHRKTKFLKIGRDQAISLINKLNWHNGYYRKDIGYKIIS